MLYATLLMRYLVFLVSYSLAFKSKTKLKIFSFIFYKLHNYFKVLTALPLPTSTPDKLFL